MQNDHSNNHKQDNKNWLWSDCKLVLRRTNPNNQSQQSYQNLQAQVELESDDIEQPFIPIFQFKKTFFYNNNTGYFWKKGIPLPPLIIKLQNSYFQLLKQDEQLIMIYCQLTLAYPKRKETHFYLEQIRTIGQKRKSFSPSGIVQFNGIVLKQSSHQKSNSKFSIVVSICASSLQQNKIILKTLISTSFYTQNNRINRKKVKKSKYLMKLISPNKFLKPIKYINQNKSQKYHIKQKILQSLKICNLYAKQFTINHPFYMIYHFSDIFNVYYNSREVKDLNQLLEKTTPELYNKSQNQNLKSTKNAYINYEIKKIKKIKKFNSIKKSNTMEKDNKIIEKSLEKEKQSNQQIKNIPTLQNTTQPSSQNKPKRKLIISARLKQGQALQKKLLMITFQNKILQFIQNQIQNQNYFTIEQQIQFKQQLQKQINNINKILFKWTQIYMKIDLLKNQPWCICWKNLQRQSIYNAYKNHYYVAYDKLINKKTNIQIQQAKMEQQIY